MKHLKHFRKIVALCITLSIILPQITVFADNKIRVSVLHEYFDNYATNSVPQSAEIKGSKNARVVEDGKNNKALYVPTGYVTSAVTFPVIEQTDKLFVASVDLKYSESIGSMALSFISNSFKFQPVLIGYNGRLTTSDGKELGYISSQNYTSISVVIDTSAKTYAIYVNYKAVAEGWRYNERLEGITAIQVETGIADSADADNCAVYMDNVRVYNRQIPCKCYASKPYSNDEIPFTEDTSEKEVSDRVYILNDFENKRTRNDNVNLAPKVNSIDFVTDTDGNTYLKLDKQMGMNMTTEATDSYIDFSVNSESKYVVIEADVRVDTPGVTANLFYIKDSSANVNMGTASISNGVVKLSDGTQVTELRKKQWTKFGFVLNIAKRKFDAYVNGKLFKSDITINNSQFNKVSFIRLYTSGNGTGDVMLDNIKVYDGKERRDIDSDSVTLKSSFKDDSYAKKLIAGKTAIAPYDGRYFDGVEKKDSQHKFIIEDGEYLVPQDVFEAILGVKVTENGNGITIDNSVEMNFDEKKIKVGGNETQIDFAAVKKDGTVYIPLYAYVNNATNKIISESDFGCFIISDSEVNFSTEERREIDYYVTKARPTAAELKEQFEKANTGTNVHPRIMARSEDFDRVRELIQTDETAKQFYADILKTADELLNVSPYDDGIHDFNQKDHLGKIRKILSYIKTLGMVYNITGDEKYAKRCKEEMMAVIDLTPIWTTEQDLDMGEMAASFGIGYDWIYNYLTDEERQKIVEWATDNVIMPIRARYYAGTAGKSWWITTQLNWNTVITGGAITLGLSFADDQTDLAFDLIEKSLRSGEYSLSSWAPDGGWYEGSSYADYTSMFLGYELASMRSALGTTYGRENARGVEDGTFYQYYLDSMSGGCNNPGDAATNHAISPGLFYADLYNSSALAGVIKEWHEKLDGAFGGVMDLLYLRPELLKDEKAQLDLDKFFSGKETQMITTREGWDNKNQMYASWAGGGVNGGHNHCDVGAFVYDVNGYRFASDLGITNYTYSGDTWDYFRRRAESHNVMVINPDKSGDFGLKKPGQDLDGWGTVKYVKKGSGGIVSAIDMQDVYKEQTSSYVRGFMTGDNRRTLTVRDEIVLKQNDSELYWNLMTLGDITITGTNTATITRGNQMVKLEFETNAAEFKLQKTAAEPYEFSPHPTDGKTNDGMYSRVLITMKASGKFYIVAKLSPMGEPAELSGIPQGTIDEWQPSEMTQVTSVDTSEYKLNNITVDGKTIAGFNSDVTTYDIPIEGNTLPSITAAAANGENVTVKESNDIETPVIILLNSPENPEYKKYYVVNYKQIKDFEPINGRKRYKVYNYAVSAVTEPENPDWAMCDGDITTKWLGDGDGEWAMCDLGSEQQIRAFALAFDYGQQRIYYFDILVSSDGENYTQVYSGQSSGTTNELEIYEITPVKAKYVKFVSHGNSTNMKTNVREFAALE